MPPITLNRRRFLGCSAAAGLALSQGKVGEAAGALPAIRVAVVGVGTRGTSLVRTLLERQDVQVVAVCDAESRHRLRASGIVEKAGRARPEAFERPTEVWGREEIDAVAIALPCDLHAACTAEAIEAGKHVYAEKPLGLTVAECDRLVAVSGSRPEVVVHVGFQRRSHPRYREGVDLIRRGELGALIEGRASWVSSNGPMNGHGHWLASRERSGDWMVEQAVHVWDIFRWLKGELPTQARGRGRRDLFAAEQPDRDVTDHYSVEIEWADGFHASFLQSWVAPADDRFTGITLQVLGSEGGIDFGTGAVTFRDKTKPRQTLHPGQPGDTRLAIAAFLAAIREENRVAPPLTLAEARDATLMGLLVRRAVDDRRVVTMAEILGQAGTI